MKRARQALTTIVVAVVFSTATASAAFAQDAPGQQSLPNVSELFQKHKDKVVSVTTEVMAPQGSGMFPFFGQPSTPQGPRMGQGSGFVVDPDGYIVTNNHVVQSAKSIRVGMENGDSYDAQLIGTDAKLDIALIKIDAGKPLPAVTLGASEDLDVGQWVVAIGNPFGLDYSVTAGIVSAKGRNIGAGPYDDFIQTDASINPGNSGGPLFNMKGEVVGVNTAIIRDGQGIGFAVPIDMVTSVLPQLRDNGYVVRGYMGSGIQDLTEPLAESFGLPREHGVLIGSVEDGGPAATAGLRPGDVVTKFGGKRVTSTHELLLIVAESRPGTTARVEYIRDGKKRQTRLAVAERPDAQRPKAVPAKSTPKKSDSRLGVSVRPVDAQVARAMDLDSARGLLVQQVAPGSAASKVLRPGDVILEADGAAVSSVGELGRALDATAEGESLRLLIQRDGRTMFVAVRL